MAKKDLFLLNKAKILSEGSTVLTSDGSLMLFVSAGSCKVTCGNKTVDLSEQRAFAGDSEKEYKIEISDGSRVIFITVSGELVSTLTELYGISDGFCAFSPEAAELFEELPLIPEKKLLTEDEKQDLAALTFHKITYTLHRSLGTRLVRRTAIRIKEYIDSHIEDKNDLSELSRVFFMSKTHLHRLFKDEYGVSPIKYLIDRKIDLSKKLLESGELKISDIADALSFSDARHFSKTFLKREGVLPSEYRKRKQ